MLLFIANVFASISILDDFKTSYVTVYQIRLCCRSHRTQISKHRMLLFIHNSVPYLGLMASFQNIVCYCLSGLDSIILYMFLQFQNIVCYCLSNRRNDMKYSIENFKTSYVTVYRDNDVKQRKIYGISKHRMLLFIYTRQSGL